MWQEADDDEVFEQDALDDPEGPQACDLDDAATDELVPCPHCGREISELAEQCPHCGDWIVQAVRPARGRRLLALVAALLLLSLLLLWLF